MNCPQCNSPIEPTDRFCENCGSVLSSVKPNPTYAAQSADGETLPPPPYVTAEAPGRHSEEAMPPMETPAAAVASAVVVAPPAASVNVNPEPEPPVINDGPYASAVRMAATGSSTPTDNPFASTAPDGDPAGYAQQQPYYQYDAPTVPPSPYYDSAATAPGTAFGLGIASLVIGIVGLLTFGIGGFFCVIGIVFAIIALALRSGYKAKGLHDTHAGSTLGLAISGLITNIMAVLLFVVIIIFAFAIAEDELSSSAFDDATIEQLIEDAENLDFDA